MKSIRLCFPTFRFSATCNLSARAATALGVRSAPVRVTNRRRHHSMGFPSCSSLLVNWTDCLDSSLFARMLTDLRWAGHKGWEEGNMNVFEVIYSVCASG